MNILKKIFFLIIILGAGTSLFGNGGHKNIAVVPFVNNGDIEYEKLCDYIPSYIILVLKDLPNFEVAQLIDIKQVMMKNRNTIYDLKNQQIIETIAGELKSDYIIGGFFNEENGQVFVSCSLYKMTDTEMNIENEITSIDLAQTDLFTINIGFDKLIPLIEELMKIHFELGFLSVTTDDECQLSIDGHFIGTTPIRVPLNAGEHSVKITHTSRGKEEIVSEENLVITRGAHIAQDIRVFRQFIVNAEEKCTVFIDDKEQGPTPFETLLYTGREYHVKVLYNKKDGTTNEIFNDTISTYKDITPLYFTAKGSLTINCPAPFIADISSKGKFNLPLTLGSLLPGTYYIKIVLPDTKTEKEWIFYDETIELLPFSTMILDPEKLNYQRNVGFAFIPSAAQFHNREPGKGRNILASAITAGVITGLCAWGWYYWKSEYESLWDKRFNPNDDWPSEIQKAENNKEMYKFFFQTGCILFSVIYSYSMVDGIITMNRINNILY